jgi:multiple sugar transport system substrate-binding protein
MKRRHAGVLPYPTTARGISRREFLKLSGAGVAGVALLGLAGCGAGEEAGETLQWQAIPSYSLEGTDPARVEYLEEAIAAWEQENDFTIEPLVTSADITAANARLLEQASQGRAPDVSMVDSYLFPRFHDFVQPLEDLGEGVSLDDYFPFARDLMTGGNGDPKGLMFTTDVRVLYYRTDLVDTPPASWDEALEVGRELSNEGLDAYLFPAGRDEATMTTTILPLFWSQGGELTDEEGNPVFGEGGNRDAMLNTFEFIRSLVQEGVTPPRVTTYGLETDINGDAASGNTAMFHGGNWQVGLLQDIIGEEEFAEQWSVAPIPAEDGSSFATTAGGQMWGIFTEDEARREAAVSFLNAAFVGDEGMTGWCNVGGYLPPREPVFDLPEYEGNEFTDTFREHLDQYAQVRPAAEIYQRISTEMQVALSGVITGDTTPEQALDNVVSAVGS